MNNPDEEKMVTSVIITKVLLALRLFLLMFIYTDRNPFIFLCVMRLQILFHLVYNNKNCGTKLMS